MNRTLTPTKQRQTKSINRSLSRSASTNRANTSNVSGAFMKKSKTNKILENTPTKPIRSVSGHSRSSFKQSRYNQLGVFVGQGISATLTPVSRRFAPNFASTHSLVANAMMHQTDLNIEKADKIINKKLVPQSSKLVKNFNSLVDIQLK